MERNSAWTKVGWFAFWFFSLLSALSAFKFVPPGLYYGFFPSLDEGVSVAAWQFVEQGIREGARHVAYHIANVGTTLAVHMFFGGLAVILIPLQVSRWWRRRGNSHKWLGWFLVPVVTISALTTIPVSFNMRWPLWSEAGFALGAFNWFAALAIGMQAILAGDVQRHRRWMIMMAALSFGAVSFRLQLPILRIWFDQDVVFPYIGWSCWVPNVLVVLWWWHHEKTRDAKRAAIATPAE